MSLVSDLQELEDQANRLIAKFAADLYAELVRRTPVDSGQLKSAWEMTKVAEGWLLSNNMNYASFIFNGRRVIDGHTLGSLQLPDGVFPILQRFNNELNRQLQELRG